MNTRVSYLIALIVHILACSASAQSFLELRNDSLHVKFDLTRGGAIAYLSVDGEERNLVNIHDEGRYIQQSYYAGKKLDRTADGQRPRWSPWTWNPIQVGDSYLNRAEILDYKVDDSTVYTKCTPMLWDMKNELAEATMEQWTTLSGNVIKVRNRLTCMRTDNLYGEGMNRAQEIPAVYPISALSELYTYFGDAPFTGASLNKPEVIHLEDGFWGRYNKEKITESWMAFVDENKWGMAVYQPITKNFLAGMAGKPGGEADDSSTSYIAPIKKEKLFKDSEYEYVYYLLIGDLHQMRTQIYEIHEQLIENQKK
jgi:hypothetical protein